jgi:hypothetical protein
MIPQPQLNQHLRHLAEVNLLIVKCRARIEHQRSLLSRLDADGPKGCEPKDSLSRLENTLQSLVCGHVLILEDLNRSAVSFFDQPELLLGRAREARLIADALIAREAKRLMERLGRSYERLAKCSEERLVGHPPR